MSTRLVLLGTAGGPLPKRTRSAPAQALVVDGRTYVVDCGNGVARQLVLAGIGLDSLCGVYLTHHHSDHNADYGNLFLLAWGGNLAEPVVAYGPPPLRAMTRQFLELNAVDIETRIDDEGRPPLRPLIDDHEISAAGAVHDDGHVRVTAVVVDHPRIPVALAYRFDTADRSVVFSGDTTYCPALIELARDADVLVHEVFYEPALAELIARSNGRTLHRHLVQSHTSVDEVGKVAQAAGVATLVLSHFVPSEGVVDEVWRTSAQRGYEGQVIVGRDLLAV